MKTIMLYLILLPLVAGAAEKVWTYDEDEELSMSWILPSPGSTNAYGARITTTSVEIYRMSTGVVEAVLQKPFTDINAYTKFHQYWIDSDDGWEMSYVILQPDQIHLDFRVHAGSTLVYKRDNMMNFVHYFFVDGNSTYLDQEIERDGKKHEIIRFRNDVVSTSPVTPGKRYGSAVHSAFFNNSGNVRVHMELPTDQKAAFSLYNAKGACLNKTRPEKFKAGTHALDVKVDKTANGVYYLKSDIGEKSDTKKVTRIK